MKNGWALGAKHFKTLTNNYRKTHGIPMKRWKHLRKAYNNAFHRELKQVREYLELALGPNGTYARTDYDITIDMIREYVWFGVMAKENRNGSKV